MIGIRPPLIIVLTTLTLACATRSAGEREGSSRTNQSELTSEELRASAPGRTLFDFINRERPQWLRSRSPSATETQDIVVYRDGVRIGGRETLHDIQVDIVQSVHLLSGAEAASRFGLNHQHGAILITTRKM